ncbi:GFA family protein [Arenimonas oryziterrae]|uniref:CENP-V/GFA domain-containing protein n=1 Tax=Arenimonas oryziterrae DSM 21050 = YC6267 TaxID=1121015 RepID=A0A091BG81_9GAMM|nr:GFA family protein [Arenimonas oryziterrae]KFN43370.1 hypothetical protein N789_08835 [Arenimonas oryziterrae DSM 21050 = YC6267]
MSARASQGGACLCGGIRYRLDAPLTDIAHCHCSMCRRNSGGIVTTWVTVPRAAFVVTRGELRSYQSSRITTRHFCSDCGALIALFTEQSPESVDVTVATLDHPEDHPPGRHIWFADRLPWLNLDTELPHEDGETY